MVKVRRALIDRIGSVELPPCLPLSVANGAYWAVVPHVLKAAGGPMLTELARKRVQVTTGVPVA